MDEKRELTKIEQTLRRDDPELAAQLETFSEMAYERHEWKRRKCFSLALLIAIVLLALVGLVVMGPGASGH